MARAYVAAGSNINPAENIALALRLLSKRTVITGISTVYRTAALGRPDQPDYYNCVIGVETEMPPGEFKRVVLRRIEAELGRNRTGDTHAPRMIDLDLIVYDNLTLKTAELTLPDPEIAARPFLSIPLRELDPGLLLMGMGRVDEVAPKLPQAGMEPLPEYTARLRAQFFPGTSP
jgi:2-amino-4-hydroxy-6-hydroxymethyldihydropteridine diphosphokinase